MRSSETSTLSLVKLRRLVVISRTSRSNTISSIGRRSYDTIAESMMARMPELSSMLTSPTEKPSRLSISSCDRTRSPPFLPPPKSWLPSSTMAAHCSAMVPESSLAAAASAASAGSSESSDASHWAAIASWSTGSLSAMISKSVSSLNDDFLEQHGVNRVRRDRDVDPPGQLFLEAEQAGGTVEVDRPQFAQIGLKQVGDARHGRLDRLGLLVFPEFEHDLDLEVLHALAGRAGHIDQHLRHVDEDRRFRHRCGRMHLFGLVTEEKEPGGAAAEDHQHADRGDDQPRLALRRRDRKSTRLN